MKIEDGILVKIDSEIDIKDGLCVIPDCVKHIGRWAFAWWNKLKSVIIPDSVTSIGFSAFENWTSLTSVVIGGINVKIVKDKTTGLILKI